LGAFLIGCILVTIWYFWQRESGWGDEDDGEDEDEDEDEDKSISPLR